MISAESVHSSVVPANLLLPAPDTFGRRAARLRFLAVGHALGAWLEWLADLADAQQSALDGLPELAVCDSIVGSPPLCGDNPALERAWQAVCQELAAARQLPCPAAGSEALDRKGRQCLALAAGTAVGEARAVLDIVVAAAQQVIWLAAARQLALPEMTPLANRDACPCCGSAPVAGIVLAGAGKGGLRYLECSLCATRWNAVRAHCTFCSEGHGVHYLGIEGGNDAVRAETCEHCHGYIKTFFQGRDTGIDPLADDLASLALDVLVGEQGFARGGPNLLLIEGESV